MKRLFAFLAVLTVTVTVIFTLGSCGKKHNEHTAGDRVRENERAASCTSDGSYDEVVYCTECGEEMSRTAKKIAKIGHKLSAFVSDNNATCTENSTKTRKCQNSGCSYKETEEEPFTATGHIAGELKFDGEYCGADPVAKVYCASCGMYMTEYGHSYEKTVIPATCFEDGKNVYSCKKCKDSYTETFESGGHINGTWVTVTAATCSSVGRAEKECLVCSEHYDSKEIETLPHSYTSKLTDDGMLYTCRECGHSYTEGVDSEIYHITFNENGGAEVEDMSVLEHTSPDLPLTLREGYIFIGWFLDEGLTESYTGSAIESDITLYAGWEELKTVEDEEDIVTDAPVNYTFNIISDTALTDSNVGSYVKIETLSGETLSARVASLGGNIYTVSADYERGEDYFVTLMGVTFEGKETKELWIKTEGDRENVIVLKDGVKAVSLDKVFGIYEANGDVLIVTYGDVLKAGETYAFYEEEGDAYRFGAKIKGKSVLEGYTAYSVEFLTVNDVFEVCDLGEADEVNFDNAEISADLEENISAAFMESPIYSQYTSTVEAMAKHYGSSVGAVKFKHNFSAKGDKFLIKLTATAELESGVEFIMSYIIELKMGFDFSLDGDKSTLVLNTNMKNTVELNVAFDGKEAHGTTAHTKAALLREYRAIFNEINERNMKLSPSDEREKENKKSYTLTTVPMQAGPVTAYVTVMGEFDFSMMGGLSAELVHTVDSKIGMRNGKFVSDYKAKLVSISGCTYAGIDVYGGVGVKLDVGFCGFNGYIKGSVGLHGELLGSAALAISGGKSYVLGTYNFSSEVLMDATVGANYTIRVFGFEKVLLDKSTKIAETSVPFITLGNNLLVLHFTDDSYTTSKSPLDLGKINCGKTDVSKKIDTSVLTLDTKAFKPATEKLKCEYVVKVTSGNVKAAINTKGTLTLRGEGKFTLTVTVKYGDVVEKTIYIKGEAAHVYTEEVVNANTFRTEANCDNKATYYYTCSFCKKISSDKYFETGSLREHNLSDYKTDDTKHWRECAYDDCDYVTAEAAHKGTEATCTAKSVCDTCKVSFGELAAHDFTKQDTDEKYLAEGNLCGKKTTYYYSCAVCGEKGNETFESEEIKPHEFADEFTCRDRECLACESVIPNTTDHVDSGNGYCACGEWIEVPGLALTLSGDSYTVSKYTGTATDVVIPATYNGKPVISIGDDAFRDCTSLKSVEIPDSVTSIGKSAFAGCNSLGSIKLPFTGAEIGAIEEKSHFGYIFGYNYKRAKIPIDSHSYHYKKPINTGYHVIYYYGLYTYNIPSSLKNVTVTKYVAPSAFYNCSIENIVRP